MRIKSAARSIAITIVAGLMFGLLAIPVSARPLAQALLGDAPPAQVQSVALRRAAEDLRAPLESLVVAQSVPAYYPLLAQTVYRFKVLDLRPGGGLYTYGFDSGGQAIDEARVERDEQALQQQRFGHLDPVLFDRLSRARADEPLDIVIWSKEPEARQPARLSNRDAQYTTTQVQAFLAEVDAARAADVKRLTDPIVERLTSLGYRAAAHVYSPAVHVQLPAARVRDVATWSEVDRIYLAQVTQPELHIAGPAIGATAVHKRLTPTGSGQFRNVIGSGIKIGLVEAQGGTIAKHPNLGGIQQDTALVCSAASTHSTALAGVLVSSHASDTGIAPAARVVATGSCSGLQSELEERSTFAINAGAQVLNLSFGSDTQLAPKAMDRFYDDVVFNRLRQVVKSAGNLNPCSANVNTGTNNVTSPGLGYNTLAVGAFDASTTSGMWPCSSGGNPKSTNNDRQKPELAAPGVNIRTTDTALTFTTFLGGTSFAAPMVSGTVALLLQRNPLLGSYPEAVRAILMATAIHDREGTGVLTQFDGVGGVAADEADVVADVLSGGIWDTPPILCKGEEQWVGRTNFTAEQRIRIALAWNSNPSHGATWLFTSGGGASTVSIGIPIGGDWPDQPSADFDLLVRDPNGIVVAQSASFDNNYEVLDFRPKTSGSHTVLVKPRRCDTDTPVAWALLRR